MDLNRREFSTAAGVSLAAIVAGCGAVTDDTDDAGEAADSEDPDETDWEFEETADSDTEDTADSTTGEADEDETDGDEQTMYEDESIPGEILLSDDVERHLAVVKHTFTWLGEPPSNRCHVHIMLENTSDMNLTVDMKARIYDENGTALSSTTDTDVEGSEPGEDDAVYSLELDNAEATATYELEITDLEDAGDAGEDASEEDHEGTDDADGSAEQDGAGNETEDESTEDDQDVEDDTKADQDEADDETNTLRLIVQDDDGNPIDHATVEIDDGDWRETQTVDDRGRVEFGVEDGEYTLTAGADGYPTLERDVEINGDVEYMLTLRSNAGDEDDRTNTVQTVVQDGNGDPIPHATVKIDDKDRRGWSETQTVDSRGGAAFAVEDGEYTLTAEANGYPPLEENIEIDGSVEYTLTLQSNN